MACVLRLLLWFSLATLPDGVHAEGGFDLEQVVDRARQLAAERHVPPAPVPRFLRELDYDAWRNIRFDPEQSLWRSEEHTSELQSRGQLVCRLLLEKTSAIGSAPAATSDAEPPDEPPLVRSVSHGLRVTSPPWRSVAAVPPNGGMAVVPRGLRPVSR